MDEEEKKDQQGPQENDDQQSPFDQTGQVTDRAKQVGKKALKGLRGLGTAGQAAGETETAGAGAQAAEKSATKVATRALQVALRAGGSNIGGWAVIIVIAIVFAMTILMAILGGQQATTATNYNAPIEEPPEPIDENVCSLIDIPGLTCNLSAPPLVENGQSYEYIGDVNYKTSDGGKELSSFKFILTIPSDIIEFTTPLPGNPDPSTSGSQTTYTWLLSDAANISLFKQVTGSSPPEYNFHFSVTAKPKTGVKDTTATVELLVE
ncbi:MAG: hypothetical protein A3B38_03645 [Candidatus Levybacteria bacterium RIFCSPLOWO2_01_FULL_36_13]|nr:MAG: hypothetical protein A2684_00580 [Candidatus Levybacteria bacterium RIFCSPHIGHO2_01_FULL_36_15b]OGH34225.1 MAG: hypothetical protein A3B38_03645 [Candidatus Levybacteria bacterium RIFCSPLOWO2_01_FULL_36_13]